MEEIFPLSGFNTPTESTDPFYLDDDPERIAADDAQRLRELVATFARGFDAEDFPTYVREWIPNLHHDLFPGSYAHLMVILLEDWDRMEHYQISLFKWLCDEHPVSPFDRWDSHGKDDMMFASELEILQKLLSPLRGGNTRPIHWIGTRAANFDDACHQMRTSMTIIKHFKEEVLAEIHGPNNDSKLQSIHSAIYSPWNSTSDDGKADMSVREFRMDACRASLGWGEFLKRDLHFSSFHQHYKSSLIESAPERARSIGFLPPVQPDAPKYVHVHPDTEPAAWCDWSCEDLRGGVLDFILKIAVWLGLARGAAAVHLFCDVARAFTLEMPTQWTDCDRTAFLYRLTTLRISGDGIESNLATPFSHDATALLDKNDEYFTVESSVRSEHRLDTSTSSNRDSAFIDRSLQSFYVEFTETPAYPLTFENLSGTDQDVS